MLRQGSFLTVFVCHFPKTKKAGPLNGSVGTFDKLRSQDILTNAGSSNEVVAQSIMSPRVGFWIIFESYQKEFRFLILYQ